MNEREDLMGWFSEQKVLIVIGCSGRRKVTKSQPLFFFVQQSCNQDNKQELFSRSLLIRVGHLHEEVWVSPSALWVAAIGLLSSCGFQEWIFLSHGTSWGLVYDSQGDRGHRGTVGLHGGGIWGKKIRLFQTSSCLQRLLSALWHLYGCGSGECSLTNCARWAYFPCWSWNVGAGTSLSEMINFPFWFIISMLAILGEWLSNHWLLKGENF